jgi:hypothetical protein
MSQKHHVPFKTFFSNTIISEILQFRVRNSECLTQENDTVTQCLYGEFLMTEKSEQGFQENNAYENDTYKFHCIINLGEGEGSDDSGSISGFVWAQSKGLLLT